MEIPYKIRIEEYPDRLLVTTRESIRIRRIGEGTRNITSIKNCSENNLSRDSSKYRSQIYEIRRKIKQYCLANQFDMFWTLTFNDTMIDSTDYQEVRRQLQSWLRYQREKYGKFDYIFIPEYHKTGRIHFHGVTNACKTPISMAINPKTKRFIQHRGKQIYNVLEWKKGFSTVSFIENKDRTASYITKYITKDLMNIPNKRKQPRYLISRGLKKPMVTYVMNLDFDISQFKPSLIIKKINPYGENLSEKELSIFHITKTEGGQLIQSKETTTKVLTNIITKIEGVEDER